MDRLRILEVQETNWPDRNVIQPHHLLERLVQRGHSVQIIDYDIIWQQGAKRRLRQPRQVFPAVNKVIDGVSLPVTRPATIQLPLLCHLSWAATSLVELWRSIAARRPDVVIGYSLTNSYPMALILKRAGIPYVNWVLEPYHTMMPQRWIRPMARIMEGLAERAADRVIAFTPQMRQYLLRMGVKAERIVIFKSGASLDVYRPGVDGPDRRQELGIAPGERLLYFMGWLYDFSGLCEIVRAVSQNPALLNGARFVIVGDGDIYHKLQAAVEQHGLAGRVILTGHRPYKEIPSLLAAADVCLLPRLENETTREIVPQKLYEYLAAGKPVVASRLPGIVAEFGTDSGIVYADHPVQALEKALELTRCPEDARRLALAARRHAEENADWEKIADEFEQVLLEVAEGALSKRRGSVRS